MMPNKPAGKLCEDCKHMEQDSEYNGNGQRRAVYKCLALASRVQNPVRGQWYVKGAVECEDARENERTCGRGAKLFEPIPRELKQAIGFFRLWNFAHKLFGGK